MCSLRIRKNLQEQMKHLIYALNQAKIIKPNLMDKRK